MIVSFEITMPGNNAWNGKWTGDGKLYCIIKTLPNPPKLGSHGYDFGDGRFARVIVREVTSSEARKMRKESKGFCGYEWMVDSIIKDGAIYSELRPKRFSTNPIHVREIVKEGK